MHVAKVVRSGGVLTIQLPAGFDLAAADEVEVTREGGALLLTPRRPGQGAEQWACLDAMRPASDAFAAAIERTDAEDTASAVAMGAPPRFR